MPRKPSLLIPAPRKLPSGSWHIQLRLGGRSISVTEKTEQACIKKARQIKAGFAEEKHERSEAEKHMTLATAIDAYCADRSNGLSPETVRKYLNIRNNHYPELMKRRLDGIAPRQWQQAVNAMLARYAPKTVKVSVSMTRTVCRAFGSDVPAVTIGGDAATKARTMDAAQFLEPEEILRFVQAAAKSKYAVPLLLALSSLRIAEIDGLDWINVTPDVIRVRQVRIKNADGHWVVIDGAKNESSVRDVDVLIPELREAILRERMPSGKVMICCQEVLRRNCAKVCAAAGVPYIGIHGLRHSFASLTAHLSIPAMISQSLGGWKNDKVMLEIYTHVAQTDIASAKQRIADFYAAP